MFTLTYTLLALLPMVLGLLALLVGWGLGLALASPIPQYHEAEAYEALERAIESVPSRGRAPRRRPIIGHPHGELGMKHANELGTKRAIRKHGLFGVSASGVPPPQVLDIIQDTHVGKSASGWGVDPLAPTFCRRQPPRPDHSLKASYM